MKILKEMKIGGHKFKIVQKELRSNLMGECDFNKNIISLQKDLPQSQKEVTLIHEILHAINSEWDNQINGHIFLESIAQQLYQVLNDNKMLK